MNAFRPLLVVSFCLALLNSSSLAVEVFNATITHDQETGAAGTTALTTSSGGPRPLSYGTGTFELNDAKTMLTFSATIYNIDITGSQTPNDSSDNLTNAHIHAAAAGSNGGVVWGFYGSPFNDNNPTDLVVTPFGSGLVGGTFSSVWNSGEGNGLNTLTSVLPSLMADGTYINFHTAQFPGGEIRGQLVRVPDAGSTAVLLSVAALGLFSLRRRFKR